mgnify:CR=1 FL=1|jgi:lipopolysaccharide export system protein LptA
MKKYLLSSGFLLLVILFSCSGMLMAKEKGIFKGIDRFGGDTDGKSMFMEGENLEYFQGETYIRFARAEIIELDDGSREVNFIGTVFLQYEDLEVTGEKFQYNTDRKNGVFTGNVVLEREEVLSAEGEIEKEGINLTCGSLFLDTDEKSFIATEKPFIKHPDFQGNGEKISYFDATERLTISGGFYIEKEKEEIKGEEITFDLKAKTFEAKRGTEALEVAFEIEEEKNDGEIEQGNSGGEGKKAEDKR